VRGDGPGARRPGGGGMGRPEVERGGPGGGGMGLPEALSGGWAPRWSAVSGPSRPGPDAAGRAGGGPCVGAPCVGAPWAGACPAPGAAPARWVGRGGGGGMVTSLAGRLRTRPLRALAGASVPAPDRSSLRSAAAAGTEGTWAAGRDAPRAAAGAGTGADGGASAGVAAAGGAAVPAAALARWGLAAAGSSGWTSRRSPSASALRRTRSAWASSIDEEWLLTPMPKDTARSSASLFVKPSSLASS